MLGIDTERSNNPRQPLSLLSRPLACAYSVAANVSGSLTPIRSLGAPICTRNGPAGRRPYGFLLCLCILHHSYSPRNPALTKLLWVISISFRSSFLALRNIVGKINRSEGRKWVHASISPLGNLILRTVEKLNGRLSSKDFCHLKRTKICS